MHRARKAAKRARYIAGVVDTRPARELATRFARMQEVLGEYQDQVVASGFVARLARDGAVAADLDALRLHFVPAAHVPAATGDRRGARPRVGQQDRR